MVSLCVFDLRVLETKEKVEAFILPLQKTKVRNSKLNETIDFLGVDIVIANEDAVAS